jgi:hypothetical protein
MLELIFLSLVCGAVFFSILVGLGNFIKWVREK